MRTPVQNPDYINVVGKLQPADRAFTLGEIDPENVSATLPVDPAWLNLHPVVYELGTTSLNGAVATWILPGSASIVSRYGQALELGRQQYWHRVYVVVTGGAVTPMLVYVAWRTGTSNWSIIRDSITNPGTFSAGPFYVPPGVALTVGTAVNGGVGDSAVGYAVGVQQRAGVAMPLVPGATVEST